MLNLLRFIAGALIGALFMVPLLWEPWFTWRVMLSCSLLLGGLYWIFCCGQGNLQVVCQAIIKVLRERRDG